MRKIFYSIIMIITVLLMSGCDDFDWQDLQRPILEPPIDSLDEESNDTVIETPEISDETPIKTPSEDVEVDFDDIRDQILLDMPTMINRNFILPTYEGVHMFWILNDQAFQDEFFYQSPLYDQYQTLQFAISDGFRTSHYTTDIFLVAMESGLNENKLYITASTPIHQINRNDYSMVEMIFTTNKNGEETIEHVDLNVEMRGRGNSTWDMPKKPYRIRFDQDTAILDLPSARNYVLLAEYSDKSLLRNTIVHKFSSMLEHIEHHIETRFVELYYNEEYQGVYVLTEQVESHRNKLYVDVDYSKLDAGFFIEQDQRMFESNIQVGLHWFELSGRGYDIKRPNTSNDKYLQAHTNYILDYFFAIEQALITQEGYEDLIDVDNFIDYFIVQELIKNVDVGWSSIFMYKRQNDVLKMGPLWDFDLAIGNANYIDYGVENFYGFAHNKNRFFHLMMHIPDIRYRFQQRYNDIYLEMIPELLTFVDQISTSIYPQALRNFERWDILHHYVWPNTPEMLQATTYQGQVDFVKHYLEARALWLYQTINTQAFLDGHYT